MAVEWGTFPDWVAAVGTVAAFLAAVIIYWNNLRQTRKSDRRSQARLFDAWVSEAQWSDYEDAAGDPARRLVVKLALSNASGQSMRGVDAEVIFLNVKVLTLFSMHVIPPTTPEHIVYREISIDVTPNPEQDLLSPVLIGLLKISVSFTDASGNRWRRTWSGDLQFITNVAKQSEMEQSG